jgi:hypothetical protein
MPMSVGDIASGKCYATKGKEFYTVLSINGGIVTYQSWKSGDTKLSLRTNAGVKAFAEAVIKEIPCINKP